MANKLSLYNTLTKKVEEFSPLNSPNVGMYACGPTVYDFSHIGHLKKYIGDDILKRVLVANGYQVKHVMNITDVGHLTSDADEGDDKLEKGAKEKQMSVWDVAKFYTDYFLNSINQVNIIPPDIIPKATEHVNEQIKLIQKLEEKGFIYITDEAVYFDVSKFPDYGKLTGQKLEEKSVGVRSEVKVDPKKRNTQDFALWFFTIGHFADHSMKWSSPWGEGFPGWHIECSAMSMAYLGDTFDIHTGGIDHIPVHHTNEIAQSEGATGKDFVKFWVHHNFLNINQDKMSKSLKNFYTIDDVEEKDYDPLSLRYLFLTGHYRDELSFSWQSLQSAQNALNNLRETIRNWDEPKIGCAGFEKDFFEAVNNDLNTPQALALMWKLVKSDYPTSAKAQSLLKMDEVLGLNLQDYLGKKVQVPQKVQDLLNQREQARKEKDFDKSDELRSKINKQGFEVEDTPTGPKLRKS